MAILTVLFVTPYFIRRNLKPLKMLADSASEVAKGNFQQPLPVLKHNDEISMLRDSFEGMQQSLDDYIKELKSTTASKAAIENELKVAHDIQMSMLPKVFPPYPERNDIDIFGSLKPAKEVGGDLFDFYIRDNQLFFCIGDFSGKGVPASLVMAVTRSLFRNISAHVYAPNQIVYALNKALTESNDTNMFVTVFVGALNLDTGHLYYCNAGHEAPLLIGNDLKRLSCDSNLPVAVIPDWEFTLQETTLAPQTTIFLYTDGLSEAENMNLVQFGYERILDVMKSLQVEGKTQPDVIVREMTEAVHSFVGEAKQNDDLTMLAIKYMNTNG
jgi:sigma-B regulation protein RsbU (phosphoserine phosphatase)